MCSKQRTPSGVLEKKDFMISMAWKFLWSMARHQWAKLRGFEVIAPYGIQAWRTRKCSFCPYNEEGQCHRCQCLILAKTMMALERCPIRLWNRVWIKRKYDQPPV